MYNDLVESNNAEQLQIALNAHGHELSSGNYETMLGIALHNKNQVIISMINLAIRQNNIKTTKWGIIRKVYYAHCRAISAASTECMISFIDFDEEIYNEYCEKFFNVFSSNQEHNQP